MTDKRDLQHEYITLNRHLKVTEWLIFGRRYRAASVSGDKAIAGAIDWAVDNFLGGVNPAHPAKPGDFDLVGAVLEMKP